MPDPIKHRPFYTFLQAPLGSKFCKFVSKLCDFLRGRQMQPQLFRHVRNSNGGNSLLVYFTFVLLRGAYRSRMIILLILFQCTLFLECHWMAAAYAPPFCGCKIRQFIISPNYQPTAFSSLRFLQDPQKPAVPSQTLPAWTISRTLFYLKL